MARHAVNRLVGVEARAPRGTGRLAPTARGSRASTHPTRPPKSRGPRRGFSLLEIILALAILCGAVATVSELSRLGMRQAEKARDLTRAQLLCDGKLAEIVAGITPAEAQEGVPFEPLEGETESEWFYTIEVTPIDDEGLTEVRVTVTRDLASGRRAVEFTLVRWIASETEDASY